MGYTAFREQAKDKHEMKQELDMLELQLFRMQTSIKEIAKKSEVVSIDRTKCNQWVVVFAKRDRSACRLMLHDCRAPWRGKWNAAIEAEYRAGNTLHIADIKGEENKGYGSVLMDHLKDIARGENVQYITGDIAKRDFDHVDRLEHFYHKHH